MIRSYQEHKIISKRAKFISVVMLWSFIGYSLFFWVDILWLKVALILLALWVSWFILKHRSQI